MIPQKIIGLLSDLIPRFETHASIDALFLYAGAPPEVPPENKSVKVQKWLMQCNKDRTIDRLSVLGKILEKYLEEHIDEQTFAKDDKLERNARIRDALAECGLQYYAGGHVSSHNSSATRNLASLIGELDIDAINYEFDRTIENISKDTYEAVSAACNILESIMKAYIEDRQLDQPAKQDLNGLWNVAKRGLGLVTDKIEDTDLLKILSGLNAIIDGIGSLRTHASSAHGRGKFRYALEHRHVELAVNAAHTISNFILETWKKQKDAT
jgi:hypothetical protein